MIIAYTTSVGFKMPEEYEEMESFKLNNDMSEWRQFEDTQYTSFVKITITTVTMKG